MTSFVPETFLQRLATLQRAEADMQDFGIVKVDDAGIIQLYNRYESELAGIAPSDAEGKNFFTQVAPCTNNRLFYGRFKEGVAANNLNVSLPYTFTYKMRPTNVRIHMYRDNASKTNWVFVKKRA
ncbi:MAG: PAS domain-containing protein [Bacteroidota bacterium]|nr:PAS domain-containing protein [Candidatus Kapabacteria bacterium]MDW8219967.1 PAS domain-containing protein [Bacteroidota bacterium]